MVETHEKMLRVTTHQGNAKTTMTLEWLSTKNLETASAFRITVET